LVAVRDRRYETRRLSSLVDLTRRPSALGGVLERVVAGAEEGRGRQQQMVEEAEAPDDGDAACTALCSDLRGEEAAMVTLTAGSVPRYPCRVDRSGINRRRDGGGA